MSLGGIVFLAHHVCVSRKYNDHLLLNNSVEQDLFHSFTLKRNF